MLFIIQNRIVDPLKNYDSKGQQNMCRWNENMSETYCKNITLKRIVKMTSAHLLMEVWVDLVTMNSTGSRMLQPCQLFDKDSCPTEVKVDNMGNKIPGSNHCMLNGDV